MLAWIIIIGLFTAPIWILVLWLLFLRKIDKRYPTMNDNDSVSIAATDD